ncbi:MAG: hemolysin family protein [Solirubrobacteraceae bacterium]
MVFDIFITFFFVFLNGFFVAAEFAIVKVRSSQLEIKTKEGNQFAKLAQRIVKNLDGYLAATQLGITLASLGLGAIGEPVVSKIILSLIDLFNIQLDESIVRKVSLILAFSTITVLHIVFGELAPKSIAIQRSVKTTLFIAYPLQFFYIFLKPFIFILNGIANFILKSIGVSTVHGSEIHSSEELQYLVQKGQESGEIDEAEYKIIKNAFVFSEQTVKQIMVPRTQVFAINIKEFNDSTIDKLIEESYSRIPCYKDSLDNIVGVVHLKDILIASRKKEPIKLNNLMKNILVVPSTKSIGELLNEFQNKHQQMAIALDEYGGTEGIITMEDILEELVGEIQDEYDNEIPFVEKISENTYNVLATASIDDINDLLPFSIEKSDQYETLAGFLILEKGRIPSLREKFIINKYEYSVLKRNKSSIILVQLTVIEDLENTNK